MDVANLSRSYFAVSLPGYLSRNVSIAVVVVVCISQRNEVIDLLQDENHVTYNLIQTSLYRFQCQHCAVHLISVCNTISFIRGKKDSETAALYLYTYSI